MRTPILCWTTGCLVVIASLGASALSHAEDSVRQVFSLDQRYGLRSPRIPFGNNWRDPVKYSFEHERHETFHRLQTNLTALYSRCEQSVMLSKDKPVRITVKLLAYAEVNRGLVAIGLKSKTHGHWAFSIGGIGGLFGKNSWNHITNAANPLYENVALAGFDNRDWHTFVLMIPNRRGPAKLYCDGQFVMVLSTPITDQQRDRVLVAEGNIHGSTRKYVPETWGENDYVFIESRQPGQPIDVDRVEVSQQALTTSRLSLPVVLDLDWELGDAMIVENTLEPSEANPLIKKSEVPKPLGMVSWDAKLRYYTRRDQTSGWGPKVNVLKDDDGFHLYVNDVDEESNPHAGAWMPTFCDYYAATSSDGLHWKLTKPTTTVMPGPPNAWDSGSIRHSTYLKENGLYRMWYGGYTMRFQQGRTGYAVSRDGVHWERPALDLFKWNGENSNICYSLQPGPTSNEYELVSSVVRVDEAAPERRYVMFLHTQGPHGFIVDVATSPDGLHWTRAAHNARHYAFEVANGKLTIHDPPEVFHEPHYWWAFVGETHFVGWVVEPEEQENVSFGLWRTRGRQHAHPIVNFGRILEVGDEWWVYYAEDGDFKLAKTVKHRMLGVRIADGQDAGLITSIGIRPPVDGWKTQQITINVSGIENGGFLKAELLEAASGQVIPGFALSDSLPIKNNASEAPLRWMNRGAALPDIQDPIQVRLEMNRGEGNPQFHALYVRQIAGGS